MSDSLRDEGNSLFGSVERLDSALDGLVDVAARAEKVCAGFIWSEGPVWKDGALFFSDVPANVLYRWKPGSAKAEVFLEPSGGILANPDFAEAGSNGLAFSPDEKTLYISVSDSRLPRVMAFEVQNDGLLGNGRLFFDAVPLLKRDLQGTCDGLKVDTRGNVFATAPGGIAVLSPDGKLLGTILLGVASNCAWGDDGTTLYITADDLVCRIKTAAHGTPFRFP